MILKKPTIQMLCVFIMTGSIVHANDLDKALADIRQSIAAYEELLDSYESYEYDVEGTMMYHPDTEKEETFALSGEVAYKAGKKYVTIKKISDKGNIIEEQALADNEYVWFASNGSGIDRYSLNDPTYADERNMLDYAFSTNFITLPTQIYHRGLIKYDELLNKVERNSVYYTAIISNTAADLVEYEFKPDRLESPTGTLLSRFIITVNSSNQIVRISFYEFADNIDIVMDAHLSYDPDIGIPDNAKLLSYYPANILTANRVWIANNYLINHNIDDDIFTEQTILRTLKQDDVMYRHFQNSTVAEFYRVDGEFIPMDELIRAAGEAIDAELAARQSPKVTLKNRGRTPSILMGTGAVLFVLGSVLFLAKARRKAA